MFTTYDLAKLINGIITLVHWAYWGIMLLMLVFCVPAAFKKPQNQSHKILSGVGATLGIIVLFVKVIPFLLILPYKKDIKQKQQEQAAWQRKRQAAEAVFKRECQKAGEKIYRTVNNVDGILLLKTPPKDNSRNRNYFDPMWNDAVLGSADEDEFIGEFLGIYGIYGFNYEYTYVDVLQKNQKDIIRYVDTNNRRPLRETLNPKNPARYAVTFEYNVDPELRKHWVAGVTIQIIDRKRKNEVIAEKTVYAFEKGLGGKGGGRMPWAFAITCENKDTSHFILHQFVAKVLRTRHFTQETQHEK